LHSLQGIRIPCEYSPASASKALTLKIEARSPSHKVESIVVVVHEIRAGSFVDQLDLLLGSAMRPVIKFDLSHTYLMNRISYSQAAFLSMHSLYLL
jgi:hypothetical protein